MLQAAYRDCSLWYAAVASAACGYLAYKCVKLLRIIRGRVTEQMMLDDLQHGVVHLFIHPRWPHGPNYFLHCLKVETFLRLAKVSYIVYLTTNSSLSPNGKLPFIVYDNVKIGGSEAILHYLTNEFHANLDNDLSDEDHAVGRAVTRMVETSLNYGLQRLLLINQPEVLEVMLEDGLGQSGKGTQQMVESMRCDLIETLEVLGECDQSQIDFRRRFFQEVKSLEVLLQKRTFLLGDFPTSYDATVFAWLHVAFAVVQRRKELIPVLALSKPLAAYAERMELVAFPDMESVSGCNHSQRFIPHTCEHKCH